MKRSEMIERISKALVDESDLTIQEADYHAKGILDLIEKLGMKAPDWIKTVEGRWGAEKHKGWEPE